MNETPQEAETRRLLEVDPNDGAFGEAAYCHHRHHLDEHSTNFDTCTHSICRAAREQQSSLTSLRAENERLREDNEELKESFADMTTVASTAEAEVKTLRADLAAQAQEVIFYRDAANAQRERAEKVEAEYERLKAAERELSDAYLRVRKLVGAWDTKPGGTDRFEVTERCIAHLKTEVERLIKERDAATEQMRRHWAANERLESELSRLRTEPHPERGKG